MALSHCDKLHADKGNPWDYSVEQETPETFDPKTEAKLVRKIDLMIVPTVSLLYLFCFIDRANIGAS